MFYTDHGSYFEQPTGVTIGLEERAKKEKKIPVPLIPLPFTQPQGLIG